MDEIRQGEGAGSDAEWKGVSRELPPILQSTPDREGKGWKSPSWGPLATSATAFIAGSSAGVGLLNKSGRRGAATVVGAVATAIAGGAFGLARFLVNKSFSANASGPLAQSERQYLDEHPGSELGAMLSRATRVGRLLTNADIPTNLAYREALTEDEIKTYEWNRSTEEEACLAWVESAVATREHIVSEDGLTLTGHVWKAEGDSTRGASADWVILAHGWNGDWTEMTHYAHAYATHGYDVLVPEMRGHGTSEGAVVGMGWLDRRDLVSWARWIVDNYGEDIRIVMHGHSMGAASVVLAAAEADLPEQVRAAVSDSAYSDVINLIAPALRNGFRLPTHPTLELARAAFMLRLDGYDLADAAPEAAAGGTRVPVMVVHGVCDTFVPPYMARRIYDALPEGSRELLVVRGANHCQSSLADPDLYWSRVFAFLDRA